MMRQSLEEDVARLQAGLSSLSVLAAFEKAFKAFKSSNQPCNLTRLGAGG